MHQHTAACNHHHEPEDKRMIAIHDESGFIGMRKAGKLAAQVLDYITPYIKAGVTTGEINDLAHDFIIKNGARPAPLGYHGFPKSVCTSLNHVVCHGIPGDKKLKTGDILNVDTTVELDGWHGDTSRMFAIGKIGVRAEKLINVTYESMMLAIDMVKPGVLLGDIGYAMQTYIEKNGFSVVRDFCGHGVGREMHMAPSVPHYGRPGTGIELKEGMFFTIEPMVNAGKYPIKVLDDQWTAVTRDKSLSAQFEHSMGVTKNGVEIFTLS